VREKKSDKMNGEDRDEAYEEKNQAEKEGQEEEREDNSPSIPKFFREVQGVGHYRGSHTSFTSLPLLHRALNHNVLECPPGETFGLRTSRVKNLSALKLIRQRAHSQAPIRMSLIKGKI